MWKNRNTNTKQVSFCDIFSECEKVRDFCINVSEAITEVKE